MLNFLSYGVWCPPVKTPKIDKVAASNNVKDTYSVKTLKESQVIISWEY
jgi:hypothetical protein